MSHPTPTAEASLGASESRSTGRTLPYLPGLDGVRAIAVAAVLLFHLPAQLLPGGFLGVDVFFVLSGFLITSLLLTELEASGRLAFGRFYLRRARRLLPALLAVLLVSSVLVLTVARDAAAQLRQDLLAALTYVTNWWYIADDRSYFDVMGRPPLLQHLWSLAVEEQFYLVWPTVALVAWRLWGRRGVGGVALVGALASTAWMAGLAQSGGVPEVADTARLYFGSDTHAMTVLVGAALATVWRPALAPALTRRGQQAVTGAGVVALVALGAVLAFTTESSPWLYRGGFLVVGLVVVPLVVVAAWPGARFGLALGNAPMRWLGTRSYGIYLWHWPIFLVTRPDLDLPFGGWLAAAISLTATGLVAEASYRWLEVPVRQGALAAGWRRARSLGVGARVRWVAAGAATGSLLLMMGTALAEVPAVTASDYLGGVTAVGTGALPEPQPSSSATHRPSSDHSQSPNQSSAPGQGPTTNPTVPPALRPSPDRSPADEPITAVGDSVLLGARSAIAEELPKVTFDAEVGRQPWDLIDRVRARERADALSRVLVIQTGTNGIPPADDFRRMLTGLKGLDRIVVVNVRSPVQWADQSNRVLAETTRGLPNVVLVDWASMSAGHRSYFVDDGTHLTPEGAAVYARAIRDALR